MKKLLLFLFSLAFSVWAMGQSTANYTFATATNGSLVLDMNSNAIDMSSGTTTLVGAGLDDTQSALTALNLGSGSTFPFIFMGQPYTTFSVSDNGLIGLGAQPGTGVYTLPNSSIATISAFANDMRTGTDGKVEAKVVGTAPNRTLVIQWTNIMIRYLGTAAPGTATWQVRLYETTGVVEYVYGTMTTNSASTTVYYVGFSNNTTANKIVTINTGTNAVNNTATPTSNSYTASSIITELNSAADGSRKYYRFTPPAAPVAPTWQSPTLVTTNTMSLNWTDNSSDELGFAIMRSDDGGTTYNYIASVAAGIQTYAATGLFPGITYFWKVIAYTEGRGNECSGSQATNGTTTITSTGTGGNWSAVGTWVGGVVPGQYDNAIIADGATVIIDAAAQCWDLTVGQGSTGILRFGTTAVALTVWHDATVAAGGTFDAGAAAGASLTHTLNIGGSTNTYGGGGGNLTVNGIFDMYIGASNGKATTIFFGSANTTLSGTGSTCDFSYVTLNKGATTATYAVTPPILEITRGFTYQGANTLGPINTHTAGVLKVGGSFTLNAPLYVAVSPSVPALGGLWINNSNYTVTGVGGSYTISGLFKMSAGTFNIGTASGNSVGFATGSVVYIEGGAINSMGRFGVSSASNTIYYNQSGGTLTLNTHATGQSSTTLASFDIGTSTSTTFIMSGGTVYLQNSGSGASGPRDFRGPVAGNANITITGGTVQLGNGSTGASKTWYIAGIAPNLTVHQYSTYNHGVTLYSASDIYKDFTMNGTGTLSLNALNLTFRGSISCASAVVTANATSSGLTFRGSSSQTFTPGTLTSSNIYNLTINNSAGVTITPNFLVMNSLTLTAGALSGSGTLTLGNAGTNAFTYINSGGSIATAMTKNYGTGANNFTYNATSGAQTTGSELPAAVATGTLTINNGAGVTLGSALSIQYATLTAGMLTTTSTNLLTITNTSITGITRSNGYVNGPLERTLPLSLATGSTYSWPIGKGSYTPFELVNPTTGAGGTCVIRAEVFEANCGGTPGTGFTALNTDRYWQASVTSGSGNFTNTQVRLTDAGVTASKKIGVNPSPGLVNGTYNSVASTLSGTTMLSSGTALVATDLNFFALGTKTSLAGGTYYVGGGAATYPNLTAVAQALKDNELSGNVVFELQSDYPASPETFPIVFEQFGITGGNWSVIVRPKSDVASMLYTSGAAGSANTLINFNGIDRITFDGRPGGAGSSIMWTIRNSQAAATFGPAIQFINDAVSNTLTYLSIESQNQNVSSGTILFGTGLTTGNDDNTISNCEIRDRADLTWASTTLPYNAVYASGSTGSATLNNSGISISNNKIYNYFYNAGAAQGLNINGGNTTWTISDNSFYVAGDLSSAATGAAYWYGIYIANSTSGNGFIISGNYIGGQAASCGGSALSIGPAAQTARLMGMYLSLGSTLTTSVQGNTIANLSLISATTSTPFYGIDHVAGNVNIGNVTPNIIGSGTGTGNIVLSTNYATLTSSYGIYSSATSSTVNISNNIIGSITTTGTGVTMNENFYGIYVGSGTTLTISGNTIGSTTTANSINASNASTTGYQSIYGIYSSNSATTTISDNTIANLNNNTATTTATGGTLIGLYVSNTSLPVTISGNTIRNFTSTCPTTGSTTASSFTGMYVSSSTNAVTITNNKVYSFSNTYAGTNNQYAYGIYFTGGAAANIIERNFVHSISLLSTGATATTGIFGIVAASGTSTYRNNMIRLGIDKDGSSLLVGRHIAGIYKSTTANNNFFFNSVVVAGTGVAASQYTACFERSSTGTDDVRDNIFANLRSNSVSGSIKNFSIYLNASTTITSDYNVLYGNGTDYNTAAVTTTNYANLAAWKGAGFDGNSKDQDPQFLVPLGTDALVDLHISAITPTPVEGKGVDITSVTKDYDDALRSGLTPVDIGADAGNFMAIAGTSKAVAPTSQIVAGNIASTVTSSGSAVSVFSFKIQDMGDDGLPTKVTGIKIKNANPTNSASWTANIAGVVLNDGSGDITLASTTVGASDILMSIVSGNLDVAEGATKEMVLKVYLKTSGIEDGKKLQFTISQTSHGWEADPSGSQFANDFGASITSNEHTITVDATKLLFTTVPSSVMINANFSATVKATDDNGNTDIDNTTSVTAARNSGTGNLTSTTGLTQSLVTGTYTWADLTYDKMETFRIQADGAALAQAVSGDINCTNTFTIGAGIANPVYGPFYNYYENNRTQMLYRQSELGGSFRISSIAFDISTVASSNYDLANFTIKVKHTSTTSFSTAYEDMTTATTVYTATSQTMPLTTGWVTFDINDFTYNGTDNLIIEIIWGDLGSYADTPYAVNGTDYGGTNYYMVYGYADSETPPLYDGRTTIRPNLKLYAATGMSYVSSTTTQTLTSPVPTGSTEQQVIGIQVVMAGSTSPMDLTKLVMNANGTTAVSDISNAKIFYTGTSAAFSTGTQFGSTIASPTIANFDVTGTQTLSDGTNYFWLTYDISPTAVAGHVIDGECTSITVSGDHTPTVTAPGGSRTIMAPLSGDYLVGAAQTAPNYTTLTSAIADLNNLGISASVRFILTDAAYAGETYPITINAVPGATALKTITILPDGGIDATISGSSASAIIKIDGGDYITIDGSRADHNSLTIENTNTGTSSAVIWLASKSASDGASNNTVKNCTLKGNASTTTLACIVSSGAGIGQVAEAQNNNNTYRNNVIFKAFYGIAVVGPTGNETGLLITENSIGSATAADKMGLVGIGLYQQATAVVSSNTIFGVSTATTSTASGILVSGSADGITIQRNTIYDIKNTNTGGYGCNGIQLNSSATAANVTVSNNLIYDVAGYGYALTGVGDNGYGIIATTGGGYNLYYNTVYMNTNQTAATGLPAAINITSGITTASSIDIRNNIFSNVQTVGTQRYSIYSGATATVYSYIDNNDYHFTASNLGYLGTTITDLAAWKTATGKDVSSISVNPSFVSSTDLHPQQPLLIAGTAIGSVTTDYSGITRVTPPTIGAYELPQVITLAASGVTASAATLNGTVNACNQTVVTSFEYGLTTAYGSSVVAAPTPVTGSTTTAISGTIGSGLIAGTLYHFRAVGTVGAAIYNGPDLTFTTASGSKTMDVTAYLEGPFNGTDMNTTLRDFLPDPLIPTNQPYNTDPWNYAGTESVVSLPANVVDWVLVELRKAATPEAATFETILLGWPKAFFLKSNGKIVALDGTSMPDIGNPDLGGLNLYVVVRHRNHLAIMSSAGMELVDGNKYQYNFSAGIDQAFGGAAGYKEIGGATGIYGMVSGDSDANGDIALNDYSIWAVDVGQNPVYLPSDNDMDGDVALNDYSKWAINVGINNPINAPLFHFHFKSQVPK